MSPEPDRTAPAAAPGGRSTPPAGTAGVGGADWQAAAQGGGDEPDASSRLVEDRLDRLAALIAKSPHNLVSRGERERVRAVHIAEARAVGEVLAPGAGERWVDLGTGGGLPGLVLALCYPDTDWTLIDSTAKKVAAVAAFAEDLGLQNVRAVTGRAEELAWSPEHRGVYDGLVSRAVAALPALLELSRCFLLDGGTLAAIKGPQVDDEIAAAGPARLALALGSFHTHELSVGGRVATVVTMRAQGSPPRRYPRRTGIPAATPLGGAGR